MTRQTRTSVAQLVNRASRLLAALGDARLKPLGFRYAQVPVFAALRSGEAFTQADLARRLGVEQPSMAQLLARMERDGAIERAPQERSARASRITVSPKTARRLPAAREALDALERTALAGFDAHEVATLAALLERVRANLERAEADDEP